MNTEKVDINYLKSIDKATLQMMDFTKWKWVCKYKDCNHYSHLKDFGVYPYMLFKNEWVNIYESVLLCREHYKLRTTQLIYKDNIIHIDETNKIIS